MSRLPRAAMWFPVARNYVPLCQSGLYLAVLHSPVLLLLLELGATQRVTGPSRIGRCYGPNRDIKSWNFQEGDEYTELTTGVHVSVEGNGGWVKSTCVRERSTKRAIPWAFPKISTISISWEDLELPNSLSTQHLLEEFFWRNFPGAQRR